ncbi:MAG: FUSC family protein, partial [Propionibacteriaceae bacterium]|nr:FUSC family protein [Propionibacteriaceae bacterium]
RRRLAGRAFDGWQRVKVAALPNSQAALVSTAAYLLCAHALRHDTPLFGPIACYLAMGYTRSRSPRRVIEMGLGATVGIGIGELFGHYAAFGVPQLLVVLLVAPLIGRFVDHSELLTFQAAMQSVIVVGMAAASAVAAPGALGRWTDALVGTLCALVFVIVHPNKPSVTPLLRARLSLASLSRAATVLARGVREADDEALTEVWRRVRAARQELNEGREALRWADQISLVKRDRQANRAIFEEIRRIYALTDRACGSVELTVRYGRAEVSHHGPAPAVADRIDRMADVLVSLSAAVGSFTKPDYARRRAIELARDLDPGDLEGESWRSLVMVSLLRSTVMDILQMTGLSRVDAWSVLPDTANLPSDGVCPPEDEGSPVWA